MKYRKLKTFQKAILKIKNRAAYNDYKFSTSLQTQLTPNLQQFKGHDAHFKHSGNCGDIIYSLPSVYTLANGANIHLHLNINQQAQYGKLIHPLGNIMLNKKMAEMLQPLLLSQPQIKTCDIYSDQSIDFDLDSFRLYPIDLKKGNIARWYFWLFGINADLGKPWLTVLPNDSFNDTIVIARSERYRSPQIDYSFLKKYSSIAFVGVQSEYDDIKKAIPNIKFIQVKSFLEMAQIIAGCKLFIGNQSFPFAIAEALKVKRLLEVYHLSPNVSPEGKNGYDFCFQPQFEKLVNELVQ